MRFVQVLTLVAALCAFQALALGEQQALRSDLKTRLGLLEGRIERGRMTGELTSGETARLRTKIESYRHWQSRVERDGPTARTEKELDLRLNVLERETERMMNNLEKK